MANEIIYVCKSKNNKNIRDGELNILRKSENLLCFEFGTDENNIKRRFYDDSKTLNEDFDALMKIKEGVKEEKIEEKIEEKKEENEKDIVEEVVSQPNYEYKLKINRKKRK